MTKSEEDIVEGVIGGSHSLTSSSKQGVKPHFTHPITDDEGLARAYKTNKDIYVNGDTLYVSGTEHDDALLVIDPACASSGITSSLLVVLV